MACLMLRIFRPIFGSGKAVVLENVLCVAKGIIDLKAKYVYAGAMIKENSYWPKIFPGELIDTHFGDKEIGDIVMLQDGTQYNKSFRIFFMEESYYVMRIISSWMTFDS